MLYTSLITNTPFIVSDGFLLNVTEQAAYIDYRDMREACLKLKSTTFDISKLIYPAIKKIVVQRVQSYVDNGGFMVEGFTIPTATEALTQLNFVARLKDFQLFIRACKS